MLVGEWEVEATVPGWGTYSGRVVARPVGATVELEWDTSAGRYVGVGLEVAGAWFVACGEDWGGLGLALLRGDGTVRWAPVGESGEVGSAALESVGRRRWVAGPDTDAGVPFSAVSLAGSGYLLEADLVGGPASRGLAFRHPGGFSVAWYPRFDQTVILRYAPGREPATWEAVWALGGHRSLAAETLRPLG